MTKLKLGLLTGVATLALTACGGGGNGNGGGGILNPPVVAVTQEDQVGANSGFGALFRVGANTDPTDPTANSVPPLSLITDPVAVP